ncbi:MAG: tyrosine-type recombinase/integrase [Gammaproteobacteria bacterium]|nr:tyrosine-type recombinase/integrase [Gammaproteobacteria bacterium]MCW5584021.1 tyrosine-type recombinase/integrase [Gammaproteobacteria bacterium]
MPKEKRQIPFSAKLKKNPPRKPKNNEQRSREYLTDTEVDKLRKSAGSIGRHGTRDEALILLMFRHGFRVSEIISLQWSQIDFKKGLLHVKRLKNGLSSTHPVRGTELRLLRQIKRLYSESPYIFASERKAPLTNRAIHHIIARAGKAAGFSFPIHPHMLRHSTGFYLANKGEDTRAIQGYLGHANIKNTVIYTELSSHRFKNFWQD